MKLICSINSKHCWTKLEIIYSGTNFIIVLILENRSVRSEIYRFSWESGGTSCEYDLFLSFVTWMCLKLTPTFRNKICSGQKFSTSWKNDLFEAIKATHKLCIHSWKKRTRFFTEQICWLLLIINTKL